MLEKPDNRTPFGIGLGVQGYVFQVRGLRPTRQEPACRVVHRDDAVLELPDDVRRLTTRYLACERHDRMWTGAISRTILVDDLLDLSSCAMALRVVRSNVPGNVAAPIQGFTCEAEPGPSRSTLRGWAGPRRGQPFPH